MMRTRWDRSLTRIGLPTPWHRDAAAAAALAAFLLAGPGHAGALGGDVPPAEVVTAVALLLLTCVGPALRRTAPITALLLTSAGIAAQRLVLPVPVQGGFIALTITVYAVAAYRSATTATVSIVGVAALAGATLPVAGAHGPIVSYLGISDPAPALVVGLLLGFLLPAYAGGYVRVHRQHAEELRVRAHRAEREREQREARAVLDERERIARELHDVAAHHLSGIVIQASAAETLIGRDPARATTILREVRGQGSETLRSMRLLVGVLRAGDERGSAGQPGLADLDGLITRVRHAGLAVSFTRTIDPRTVHPPVGFAAYRIVQESLTNAQKHARGATVDVTIAGEDDQLHVVITNGPPDAAAILPDAGAGFGVAGMQERAALLDGRLTAGPTGDGGWQVRAHLPLHPRHDAPRRGAERRETVSA